MDTNNRVTCYLNPYKPSVFCNTILPYGDIYDPRGISNDKQPHICNE